MTPMTHDEIVDARLAGLADKVLDLEKKVETIVGLDERLARLEPQEDAPPIDVHAQIAYLQRQTDALWDDGLRGLGHRIDALRLSMAEMDRRADEHYRKIQAINSDSADLHKQIMGLDERLNEPRVNVEAQIQGLADELDSVRQDLNTRIQAAHSRIDRCVQRPDERHIHWSHRPEEPTVSHSDPGLPPQKLPPAHDHSAVIAALKRIRNVAEDLKCDYRIKEGVWSALVDACAAIEAGLSDGGSTNG